MIESEELRLVIKKYDFTATSPTLLEHCSPFSPGKFYYN